MKQLKINFCSESGIGEGIGGSKTAGMHISQPMNERVLGGVFFYCFNHCNPCQ